MFTHNYDRLAFTRTDLRAAWLDRDGKVTLIGPETSLPDFGVQSIVTAVGFDKLDNFYYTIKHSSPQSFDYSLDYYRVPAGSTSNGEMIGTVFIKGGEAQATFGRLPDGTMGLGAERPLNAQWKGYAFDPDRHTYFYVDQGRIYKTDTWGDSDLSANDVNSANAFLPPGNYGIASLMSSQDGSQLMFVSGNDHLYTMSTSGQSTPTQLNVPQLTSSENSSTWAFRGWA